MERYEIEELIDERLEAVRPKSDQSMIKMLRVQPFKAFDDDDFEVEVVGISYLDEDMNFVAIKERDGELYPVLVSGVYRSRPGPL